MINVIRKLTTEKDIPFLNIVSFKTASHIGIFCHIIGKWMVVLKSDIEFYPEFIDNVDSLDELDITVFNVCEEHIESVSESNEYSFNIVNC